MFLQQSFIRFELVVAQEALTLKLQDNEFFG